MDATVEQWELFPLLAVEAPAKSKFRQWMDAQAKHGALVTFTLTAEAMNVSRSRVHQLVNEGRIETVDVYGERFIPASAIDKFLASDRGPGIRRNTRKALGAIWTEANRVADQLVEK